MRPRLPELLEDLLAAGRWPRTTAEENAQNLRSGRPAHAARIEAFAPGETQVFLYAPPFRLVADLVAGGESFWDWHGADPAGLERSQALVIGDFGLGSDAPVVLDFRSGNPPPRVLRLRYGTELAANRWVEVAPSFEQFVVLLGI